MDCQRQDGVVTESVVNQTSLEQPSSQEDCIATQSSTARNDDDGTGGSNTLSLNLDNSSSVTLSTCKQVTSPQGEALGRSDTAILGSSSQVGALGQYCHRLAIALRSNKY